MYNGWGAHWRHMANMTERSMRGGDAALCQIILTTYCLVCLMQKKIKIDQHESLECESKVFNQTAN